MGRRREVLIAGSYSRHEGSGRRSHLLRRRESGDAERFLGVCPRGRGPRARHETATFVVMSVPETEMSVIETLELAPE